MLLLNLLYHRPYLTLATIERECEISQRSAYRYINSLSAARFPVFFDATVKGYRLMERGNLVSHLSTDETTMIFIGLLLLERLLAPGQLGPVRRARTKLESKLSLRAQELIAANQNLLADQEAPGVVRDIILMSLVSFAAGSGRSLRLEYTEDSAVESVAHVDKPKLVFNGEWMIGARGANSQSISVPLRLVSDLQIV